MELILTMKKLYLFVTVSLFCINHSGLCVEGVTIKKIGGTVEIYSPKGPVTGPMGCKADTSFGSAWVLPNMPHGMKFPVDQCVKVAGGRCDINGPGGFCKYKLRKCPDGSPYEKYDENTEDVIGYNCDKQDVTVETIKSPSHQCSEGFETYCKGDATFSHGGSRNGYYYRQQRLLSQAAGYLKPGESAIVKVYLVGSDGSTTLHDKLSGKIKITSPTEEEVPQGKKHAFCSVDKQDNCENIKWDVKRLWWKPWEIGAAAGGVVVAAVATVYAFKKMFAKSPNRKQPRCDK
jgi:hypothetical protein